MTVHTKDFIKQTQCYHCIDRLEWPEALAEDNTIASSLVRTPAFENLEWAFVKNWFIERK